MIAVSHQPHLPRIIPPMSQMSRTSGCRRQNCQMVSEVYCAMIALQPVRAKPSN